MNGRLWLVLLLLLLLAGGTVIAVRALTDSEESKRQKLMPDARDKLDQLRAACAGAGIETRLGETLRSSSQQAANVAAGLSSPTTLGKGWHTVGRAWHLYAIVDGEADTKAEREDLILAMHKLAVGLGIRTIAYDPETWAKKMTHTSKGAVWDANHFEYHGSPALSWEAAADQYVRLQEAQA